MRYRNTLRLLVSSMIAVGILACGLLPAAGTETQADPPGPVPAEAGQAATGGCNHPLFPSSLGASWSYKSTGSYVGEYTYTEVVTDLRADGFTITSDHIEGFTRVLEWSCTPQGLVSGTIDGGAAAGFSSEQFQMDLVTTGIEGITLPIQVKPGDQWTQTLKTEGKGDIGGSEVLHSGTTLFTMNVLSEESVTVPAGTFTVMKIKTDITLDVLLTIQGSTTPYPSAFAQLLYWAPGVGLVKRETTQLSGGSSYTEIVELQSYRIP